MKKIKVVEIFHALNALQSAKKSSNAKFRYGLKKDLSIIEPEIKVLQEIEKENAEPLKPMQEKRDAFIKEKGKKDGKGGFYIPMFEAKPTKEDLEIVAAYEEKVKELEEEFKDILEAAEEKEKEYFEMLKETDITTELNFHKISIENCPDWITEPEFARFTDLLIEVGIISE